MCGADYNDEGNYGETDGTGRVTCDASFFT